MIVAAMKNRRQTRVIRQPAERMNAEIKPYIVVRCIRKSGARDRSYAPNAEWRYCQLKVKSYLPAEASAQAGKLKVRMKNMRVILISTRDTTSIFSSGSFGCRSY